MSTFVCRKKKFTSKSAANMHIIQMSAFKARNAHVPIRSYYCKECSCWHVTSQPHRLRSQRTP